MRAIPTKIAPRDLRNPRDPNRKRGLVDMRRVDLSPEELGALLKFRDPHAAFEHQLSAKQEGPEAYAIASQEVERAKAFTLIRYVEGEAPRVYQRKPPALVITPFPSGGGPRYA